MKRILFLLVVLLLVVVEAQAQLLYNVTVKDPNGFPISGVIVYSFLKKNVAKSAYSQATDTNPNSGFGYGRFDEDKYPPLEEQETDPNGMCVITADYGGAFMLDGNSVSSTDGSFYEVAYFNISDCAKDENDNNITLVFVPKSTEVKKDGTKTEYTDFEKEAKRLKEVPATAYLSMASAGGGVERFGRDYIRIKREIDIEGEHARDNARFVAFPTVIYDDFEDSICQMPPMVVDGIDYSREMARRMGFNPSTDILNDFKYDGGTYLHSHQSERIIYAQWAKIEKGTSYHVPGVLWYEDCNGVYHQDSIIFSDGKEQEPMRFLNWEEARKFANLDVNLPAFQRSGKVQNVDQKNNYKLNFEQGAERLNFNDSTTLSQRNLMFEWLDNCHTNKNGKIKKITVRAFSSPEGSESRNRALSRGRTQFIEQLLKGRYRGVEIEPVFDEFDNVVPWSTVADSLTTMEDTLARQYADVIRGIVEVHDGFDNQYKMIRANKELYDYLDKNILDKVRFVSVEASIIVQTVLTKEEVIENYHKDPNFIKDMLPMPYQCYYLLCYLAAEERWDELYDISKKVYEYHSIEHVVQRQYLKSTSDTSKTLATVRAMVPYPLAGYFYALASMQRGEVNDKILKPYLDDGRVSQKGMNRHDKFAINVPAFIVAQILMYCQDESFDKADNLIRKYNLISNPDLKGLIMFVRCLDGQYSESEEVRQYVMSTSDMNRAVILAAIGEFQEALKVLYNGKVPQNDAKVEYMKAICHFRLQINSITRYEALSMPVAALYKYDDGFGDEEKKTEDDPSSQPWAIPMLNAIKLDESNLEYLKNDGYFNRAYRQMIAFAWSRMKDGISIERISKEYAALVSKMVKEKEKSKK